MPIERQGARNDLADLYDQIKIGKTNAEIIETNPEYMFLIDKIERARQTIREDQFKDTFRQLEVTYIFGPTGTGKTRSVMEQYGYDNVFRVTDYEHPFDSYKGQNIVVFEEFRSSLKIQDMLNYLDGYPLELPCRYANKIACYNQVYIITNINLAEQYQAVQAEHPETWNAFLRRIKTVKIYNIKTCEIMNQIRFNALTYRKKVFRRDVIVINHDQTKNKIFNSEWLLSLPISSLQEVGFILMHMCRNKNSSAIIENDQIEFWAYVNTIILSSYQIDHWIQGHHPLFSFIDSQLINELKPRYNDTTNKLFHNSLLSQLFYHDFFPAVWTGFAYLEGLCRRICKNNVNAKGIVTKAFKIQGTQFRTVRGNKAVPKSKKGKTRISNLYILLELTRRNVSDGTKLILRKFFKDYSSKLVFDWRNDSLHGSEGSPTTIIVLYCLISILLLDLIKSDTLNSFQRKYRYVITS